MPAWNWWQFQPRVLEHADLREPLRDEEEVADRRRCARTCAARATSRRSARSRSRPGATGAPSGTSATVRSSGLPSSGAMKRRLDVRSVGVPSRGDQAQAGDVDPAPVGLAAARRSGRRRPALRSRIQVDAVLRQAL